MKKILVVLALLSVCGLAFSVTGTIQVRLNPNGQPAITEWGGTLDDIVMAGRHDTYAGINFDGFGLVYAPRDGIAVPQGVTGAYGSTPASGGTMTATSPGYFEINGLKFGNLSLTVGGSFWMFGESAAAFQTNALGATNVSGSGSAGYTRVDIAAFFQVPLSDTIKLQGQPWDRIWIAFGTGSATANFSGSPANTMTNAGTSSFSRVYAPIYLDMTFDKLSLELFPKIDLINQSDAWTTSSTTNSVVQTQTLAGALVRGSYSINDQFSIMVHIGAFSWGTGNTTIATSTTNSDVLSALYVPIFGGIIWSPASWFNMDLGLGYLMVPSSTETVITGNQTNVINAGGGLQGQWNFDDIEEHYYNVPPFASIGGSAKFASDWELGFKECVGLNVPGGNGFGTTGYYLNTKNTLGTASASQLFHWDNGWCFDGGGGTCYLKYSKDNVTLKGTFGTSGQLLGLFQWIEMSINF